MDLINKNMNKRALILGAGTYGEVYASYLKEAGYEILGFLDDDSNKFGKNFANLPVLGRINELGEIGKSLKISSVFCPIGNNQLRVKFLKEAECLGFQIPNFIHHTVKIAPNVCIENKGIYILPSTVIMPFCKIENYCMTSVNSIVSHHTKMEEGVFISFGVNLGASILVKKYAYIGIGATIMTGVSKLGEDCLIGAGAVVIKDVPDHAVMAGVPAKLIRYKN